MLESEERCSALDVDRVKGEYTSEAIFSWLIDSGEGGRETSREEILADLCGPLHCFCFELEFMLLSLFNALGEKGAKNEALVLKVSGGREGHVDEWVRKKL